MTLTNISKQTCSLAGYPALVAWSSGYQGSTTSTGLHRLKITLTQGSLYEVPDPGPSSFSLAPAASAWFAVGTGTAWGPPVKVIPDLTVYLTPTTSSGVPVRVSLDADGPPGQPVPVKVTAFSAGTPPKA